MSATRSFADATRHLAQHSAVEREAGRPTRRGRRAGMERALSNDRESLKAEIVARRGYWAPFHEGLLEMNPAFLEAYLKFQDGPARSGHLEAKVREFIYIAIDGAVSHLYERGLRRHIADALRLGASKEEVLQVIMLATAVQGQIPNEIGHAILMEEMRE